MEIRLENITQKFGDFLALDGVSFLATSNGIHAIVGENGAGKTTLMRVLYGALRPSQGDIFLDGRKVTFHKQSQAIASGIGMVSQHYSIIPELTCLQNLILGAEPGWVLADSAAEARASELAQRMGYEFSWQSLAETLSPAGKQKLEILKLLWRNCQVMILDEPTAMLSPSDSDALFESLKNLAEQGATIIVVTHRIPEVMEHCETVTVLRSGKLVAVKETGQTSPAELAELIVGHAVQTHEQLPFDPGPPSLEISGLSVLGYRGDKAVNEASLSVCAGEVVGIAGVDGNGQRELFQAIIGRARVASGTISFLGNKWSNASPRSRIEQGLRLIPEDRHAEGVIEEWSLEENSSLGLQRTAEFRTGSWINLEARKSAAKAMADRFSTKYRSLKSNIGDLSGGNQQRFVAARALNGDVKLILAFQPTRGLDIDGTAQVYSAIRSACRSGASALVVSFDLDELLENCDRVVVIDHGKIVNPPADKAKDRAAIGALMVGAG